MAGRAGGRGSEAMNYLKTGLLLAAMTALFGGIGFLIGGEAGMLIALAVAAAMNLFAYWNIDRMVLSMYHARAVDARSAPDFPALKNGRESGRERVCQRG